MSISELNDQEYMNSGLSNEADAEHSLIERIQQGDKEAFRQIYDQYVHRVYRYILARVGDINDAEDITADTFVKAWEAFPSFKWRGKPAVAWFYRIAHNLIMDRFRKKRNILDLLPGRYSQDEHQFKRVEHRDEIQSAVSTLTYEQQMILHLHFYEGYDLKEVADILEKTPSAVRVAKFRALERLRSLIKNDET